MICFHFTYGLLIVSNNGGCRNPVALTAGTSQLEGQARSFLGNLSPGLAKMFEVICSD